ncbi:MAG: hypothetical protein L0H96_21220 [Humibacillus sp.]|nr:hypothetical protein [Humibacillus sp.]MDN5779419.1 hypothetical protein [Humibacillus sp.]
MEQLDFTDLERAIRDGILARHRGLGDLGANDDWPLQTIYDSHLPIAEDEQESLRREDVCRAITVAAVAARCLAPAAAAIEMANAWSTGNSPERLVSADDWLQAFNAVGYIADADSPPDAPVSPKRLWRGATTERRFGLAWTERSEVAQSFADDLIDREAGGLVFWALVRPSRVKARFNAREEHEWIVDTRGLDVDLYTGPDPDE